MLNSLKLVPTISNGRPIIIICKLHNFWFLFFQFKDVLQNEFFQPGISRYRFILDFIIVAPMETNEKALTGNEAHIFM